MEKSQRGATFLVVALGTSLIGGVCSALRWTGSNAVALLVATALLTALMSVLSAWVAFRTWRVHRATEEARNSLLPLAQVQSGIWHWLSRRQWNILTLGFTFIVALTGGVAGLEVLHHQPVANGQPAAPTTATATAAAPTPAPQPTTTTVQATPSLSASATVEPTVAPSGSEPATPGAGAIGYLDSLDAVNGGYTRSAVMFSGQRYPRSITMYCLHATSDYIEWNVAGYQTFKATLGVPDTASDAFGGIAEMIFYDQDNRQLGKTYDVSLGHPQAVQIPLNGAVHLRVTCSGRDIKTNQPRGFYGGLGDASIIS